MIKIKLIMASVLSLLMFACSDGPEQYQKGKADPNTVAGTQNLGGVDDLGIFSIPSNFPKDLDVKLQIGTILVPQINDSGDDIDDELVIKNSSEPIVYGKSFAGITFDTTFDDAKFILSEPLGNNSDGGYGYREGVTIYYRTQEPKVPVFAFVNGSYLGAMDLGADLGKIKVGSELKAHFGADKTGELTIKKYFNVLEEKQANYNCLQTSECELKSTDSFYLFILPGAMFLISRDRLQLAEIRLIKKNRPGNLKNNFDLIDQKVVYSDTEGNPQTIGLGEVWGDLKTKINGEELVSVGTDDFNAQYDGTILIMSKSQFGRDYRMIGDEEKLESFYHSSSFTKNFLLNGKYISYEYDLTGNAGFTFSKKELDESQLKNELHVYDPLTDTFKELEVKYNKDNGVIFPNTDSDGNISYPVLFKDGSVAANNNDEFSAVSSNILNVNPKSQLFGLKVNHLNDFQKKQAQAKSMVFADSIRRDFFFAFNKFIEAEYGAAATGAVQVSRSSGLESKELENNISHFIMTFDPAAGTGKFVEYEMNELSGNFTYFYSDNADNQFNQIHFPFINLPVAFSPNQKAQDLLGYKLGDTFSITEIDNGREEATVTSADGKLVERVSFNDEALRKVVYDTTGVEFTEKHQTISLGDLGVSMYLTQDPSDPTLYKAIQISSGSFFNTINGLCGLNDLDLKIGQPTIDVLAKINTKVGEMRKTTPDFNCYIVESKYEDGSAQISELAFPEQRIKLYFGDNQLSSVGIYANESEVK